MVQSNVSNQTSLSHISLYETASSDELAGGWSRQHIPWLACMCAVHSSVSPHIFYNTLSTFLCTMCRGTHGDASAGAIFALTSLFNGISSTFAGPAFCAAAVDALLFVFGAPPSMLLLSENRGTSLQRQQQTNCSLSQ
jgi:hypothetical protein